MDSKDREVLIQLLREGVRMMEEAAELYNAVAWIPHISDEIADEIPLPDTMFGSDDCRRWRSTALELLNDLWRGEVMKAIEADIAARKHT